MRQVLDDALDAWKRGQFEGTAVFTAPDPGGSPTADQKQVVTVQPAKAVPAATPQETTTGDPNNSSIRIDLSGIGGRAP